MKSKLFLMFAFALGVLLVVFMFSGGKKDELEPVPVMDGILAEVETPYDIGYRAGYRAFQMQMGEEVPPEVRYVSYTSGHVSELGEDASKGYVDGYHRAADSYHCPRPR